MCNSAIVEVVTGGVQPGDIRRGAGVSGKLPFSKVPTHPIPVTLVE